MFSVRGRGTARRLAVATLVSGFVAAGAIATAGPALADEAPAASGGATAELGHLKIFAEVEVIEKEDGKETRKTPNGGLFEMTVDNGGVLRTYCIDYQTDAIHKNKYKEVGWDQSSLHNNPDAGKILWILKNSYPNVSVDSLAATVKATGLTEQTAAAATQAAIWHFSDKVEAKPFDEQAQKLTDYLLKNAQAVAEPKASLSLSPASVAGKSGERVGPIKVGASIPKGAEQNPITLSVTPGGTAGVGIVDKDGKAVTTAKDGDEVFIDVPKGSGEGAAEVKAEISTQVPLGRAFVTATDDASQTMILAGSTASTVTAKADGTWAKKGVVPAVTVAKDCAKGGLEVIASNEGDEDWTFDLKGTSYTVAGGETKTISVPLAEDEAYNFTITGPNNFSQTFEGVLDCKTAPGPKPSETTPTTEPSGPASPSPSTTGGTGTTGGGDTAGGTAGGDTTTGGGDLAETGSSNATPMIAGIAAALVVVGGAAVFFLRRKKTAGQ